METKKWYMSKAVWAGAIAVLIAVYNVLLQELLNNFGVKLPAIPEFAYGILAALGLYGRVVATSTLTR